MPELNEVFTSEETPVAVEEQAVQSVSTTRSTEKKVKYLRPPIEQITSDTVDYLTSRSIGDNKVEKLGFSCGKIIYGFKDEDGEEFRVMALKARKKSLSVEGKSRAMMFFGINDSKNVLKLYKDLPVSTSERGACSCQVKEPVYVTLDKVTFTENFNNSVSEVMSLVRNLIDITIDQKTVALEKWVAEKKQKKLRQEAVEV